MGFLGSSRAWWSDESMVTGPLNVIGFTVFDMVITTRVFAVGDAEGGTLLVGFAGSAVVLVRDVNGIVLEVRNTGAKVGRVGDVGGSVLAVKGTGEVLWMVDD